jgi:hypothetical protein
MLEAFSDGRFSDGLPALTLMNAIGSVERGWTAIVLKRQTGGFLAVMM